jgi:hypothetical protein
LFALRGGGFKIRAPDFLKWYYLRPLFVNHSRLLISGLLPCFILIFPDFPVDRTAPQVVKSSGADISAAPFDPEVKIP